ncbi:MAG: 23S rRNA (uracil(1939)-C(5))-methyltransferase RlmD [Lachnospiraceae bacterium]|nr:23S rRNA (uracil(1939)-C(5))-methyltransferase RlmD [Lachnospiraceae bacterium]
MSRTDRKPKKQESCREVTMKAKENTPRTNGGEKKSKCKVSAICGGCQYIDMDYKEQLAMKQRKTQRLLKKYVNLDPIIGMNDPYHYRNKVHAVFSYEKNRGRGGKGGHTISGIYQEGTHRVVNIDRCFLEDGKADAIIVTIREQLKSFKISVYDEDTGYGLLRHVLVRTAHKTGQIMVTLVLASPILPSKNNFVKALCKAHPEITTVTINVNDRHTSVVLGTKESVIYGKGYIEDELCGKIFKISPRSFYQINSVQTEKLYSTAISYAGLSGKERVLDAYCGIGTIGLCASDKAGEVIGVEVNKDAVRDAVGNAKRNKAEHVTFYCQDAGAFMQEMAAKKEKVDVVFMDPPRSGSDEAFLSSVVKLSPDRIVYISCNPETLARDLEYLTKHRYRVVKGQPVDMFPNTEHVETVVLLSQQKPDAQRKRLRL